MVEDCRSRQPPARQTLGCRDMNALFEVTGECNIGRTYRYTDFCDCIWWDWVGLFLLGHSLSS